MPVAITQEIRAANPEGANNRIQQSVIFVGTDVPGGIQYSVIEWLATPGESFFAARQKIAQAIEEAATLEGLPVPPNNQMMIGEFAWGI